MNFNLKMRGPLYEGVLLLAMFLATACSREEVEPVLPEENSNSMLTIPRSNSSFPDVIINLSNIDWNLSNVYRAWYEDQPVAEICKEYLYAPGLIDSSAIVVYLIDPVTRKADLSQGYVAQVHNHCTERADIKQIHGGTVAFSMNGDSTVCNYTPGTSPSKTVVCIANRTRSTLASFEETTLLPEQLEDYDHNHYGITKIGMQYWQREDLGTTHYANGIFIDQLNWDNPPYGRHYAFPVVENKIFFPGWKIPSEREWKQLDNYTKKNIKALKSKTSWLVNEIMGIIFDRNGTNLTGFNAFCNGWYDPINKKTVIDYEAYYFVENARYLVLSSLSFSGSANTQSGFAIRCIRYE